MQVTGSIIARLGSKRLPYKNLLPIHGVPMVVHGIRLLRSCPEVTSLVVSTESELIARIAIDAGATVLRRPPELAADNVPSVPVFQHIVEHFPCDVHVNYNPNFPFCDPAVISRGIALAAEHGEALSVPYAVWAQSREKLRNYGDPWTIGSFKFEDSRIQSLDVHTEEELLEAWRRSQGPLPGW